MLILGIESSCDETAAAVVRDGGIVLSSEIASQISLHQEFGGVVPEIAARAHLQNIDPLVDQALHAAGVSLAEIDAIAVTQGPGLIGALLVGVSYAKGLALAAQKPLIPVDHVHAHIHGALLDQSLGEDFAFPCLALVASGGHTNLYFMANACSFRLIAYSEDDACGECFDKVAKLMGLEYPGGPRIEQIALHAQHPHDIPMPQSMEQKDRLRFSYSGLKTHMATLLAKEGRQLNPERRANICAAFQESALDQLVRKIATAEKLYPQAKTLLIAGGVAANQKFRSMIADKLTVKPIFPHMKYCGDNAAMIAGYGYYLWQAQPRKVVFTQPFNWDSYSRYDYASVMELSQPEAGKIE